MNVVRAKGKKPSVCQGAKEQQITVKGAEQGLQNGDGTKAGPCRVNEIPGGRGKKGRTSLA